MGCRIRVSRLGSYTTWQLVALDIIPSTDKNQNITLKSGLVIAHLMWPFIKHRDDGRKPVLDSGRAKGSSGAQKTSHNEVNL